VKAVEEPQSPVDLRARTTAMLPRVDLPEVILEVMSWEPALERSRLSHVLQNYFRPETLAPANAPLVARQAGLPLARAWGGGLVAAVDGMRFIVPVPAAFARPNRKFFGSKRGMTWLNAINDQGIGRGAKVVSGTVRDSLHMVDVIFGLDGGELPEVVVTDTGSYSDVTFGLLELLDNSYRPALADLPDQKGWRINPGADNGPLNTFARAKIDLRRVRRNWEDMLRVVASIYTGTVRAYDVVTMLQRDGHPTALGEGRAVPPLRTGPRESARRARTCPELRGFVDNGVPGRRRPQAQSPGLPRAGRGHDPPVTLRQPASGSPRGLQLRPARPGPWRHPRPVRRPTQK
jgi:hypothetical protein